MLQHDQTDLPAVPPTGPGPISNAADARVTPDELNAALKALEDQQNSTVAIGSVVDELQLNATPEQIWDQVQKQRAQTKNVAQDEAQSAVRARVTVNGQVITQSPAAARRRLRAWHDIKAWIWILFWCSGGIGVFSALPHLLHHQPPGFVVSGDGVKESYQVKGIGTQRDVTVSGDNDNLTVYGNVRVLTVDGDENTVTVIGSVQGVSVSGDSSKVHWTKDSGNGILLQPNVSGDDNDVSLSKQ